MQPPKVALLILLSFLDSVTSRSIQSKPNPYSENRNILTGNDGAYTDHHENAIYNQKPEQLVNFEKPNLYTRETYANIDPNAYKAHPLLPRVDLSGGAKQVADGDIKQPEGGHLPQRKWPVVVDLPYNSALKIAMLYENLNEKPNLDDPKNSWMKKFPDLFWPPAKPTHHSESVQKVEFTDPGLREISRIYKATDATKFPPNVIPPYNHWMKQFEDIFLNDFPKATPYLKTYGWPFNDPDLPKAPVIQPRDENEGIFHMDEMPEKRLESRTDSPPSELQIEIESQEAVQIEMSHQEAYYISRLYRKAGLLPDCTHPDNKWMCEFPTLFANPNHPNPTDHMDFTSKSITMTEEGYKDIVSLYDWLKMSANPNLAANHWMQQLPHSWIDQEAGHSHGSNDLNPNPRPPPIPHPALTPPSATTPHPAPTPPSHGPSNSVSGHSKRSAPSHKKSCSAKGLSKQPQPRPRNAHPEADPARYEEAHNLARRAQESGGKLPGVKSPERNGYSNSGYPQIPHANQFTRQTGASSFHSSAGAKQDREGHSWSHGKGRQLGPSNRASHHSSGFGDQRSNGQVPSLNSQGNKVGSSTSQSNQHRWDDNYTDEFIEKLLSDQHRSGAPSPESPSPQISDGPPPINYDQRPQQNQDNTPSPGLDMPVPLDYSKQSPTQKGDTLSPQFNPKAPGSSENPNFQSRNAYAHPWNYPRAYQGQLYPRVNIFSKEKKNKNQDNGSKPDSEQDRTPFIEPPGWNGIKSQNPDGLESIRMDGYKELLDPKEQAKKPIPAYRSKPATKEEKKPLLESPVMEPISDAWASQEVQAALSGPFGLEIGQQGPDASQKGTVEDLSKAQKPKDQTNDPTKKFAMPNPEGNKRSYPRAYQAYLYQRGHENSKQAENQDPNLLVKPKGVDKTAHQGPRKASGDTQEVVPEDSKAESPMDTQTQKMTDVKDQYVGGQGAEDQSAPNSNQGTNEDGGAPKGSGDGENVPGEDLANPGKKNDDVFDEWMTMHQHHIGNPWA